MGIENDVNADPDVLWLCSRCLEAKPPSQFGASRKVCLDCQLASTPHSFVPVERPKLTYENESVPLPPEPTREVAKLPKTHKRCTKCGELKPFSEFWGRGKNGGLESWCKTCKRARNSERFKSYYERHNQEIKDRVREYNREKRRKPQAS